MKKLRLICLYTENKTQLYTDLREQSLNIKTDRSKVKGWEMVCHANSCPEKVGLAILIPDNVILEQRLTLGIRHSIYYDEGTI